RPGGRTPLPRSRPSVSASSPCANRTSPSTTSVAPSTPMATPSAPSPSPRSSRLRASPGSRAAPTTNAPRRRGRRPARSPTSGHPDCRPRPPPPTSAAPSLSLPPPPPPPFAHLPRRAGLPGSQMAPPPPAVPPLLALKLFGNPRHSHVMSYVLDEGLALFA